MRARTCSEAFNNGNNDAADVEKPCRCVHGFPGHAFAKGEDGSARCLRWARDFARNWHAETSPSEPDLSGTWVSQRISLQAASARLAPRESTRQLPQHISGHGFGLQSVSSANEAFLPQRGHNHRVTVPVIFGVDALSLCRASFDRPPLSPGLALLTPPQRRAARARKGQLYATIFSDTRSIYAAQVGHGEQRVRGNKGMPNCAEE
ncbi:hypothetical protein HPB48_015483 [Haemaphysalis longicornis]|uniref:Uncharacterized protein n=1 Tax=Haemaphysalis longicornis TaxID=44386 RepID=A0A9J6FI36_HAELO|nr:hypothetical protein HPB48_015483 [Haemaphysalis longicornis]